MFTLTEKEFECFSAYYTSKEQEGFGNDLEKMHIVPLEIIDPNSERMSFIFDFSTIYLRAMRYNY